MASTRDQIIEITCELLAAQGYHATGLNQILAESGTPKGSLYYYFPQGKEELTAEAIHKTGALVAAHIHTSLATITDPGKAVSAFVHTIAHHIEATNFRSGGPLATVALETVSSSERLNLACSEAYRLIEQAFADKFVVSGYSAAQAAELATFVTASIEGGTMLSRTYHSSDPLKRVADTLERFLTMLPKELI